MSESRQSTPLRTHSFENMTSYATIDSPVGELLLVGEETTDGIALTSLSMSGQRNAPKPAAGWRHASGAFGEVIRQLDTYFAGELTSFDLDLAPRGTEFQQRVWKALHSIRYGTTISYGELAGYLGVPRDRIQALGAAIAANPLLIICPCHRVIGADGSMRGYAGGAERKQQLLVHEGALQPMLTAEALGRPREPRSVRFKNLFIPNGPCCVPRGYPPAEVG
jgi:methylated-DNA-[protein]-cysteine S-methyltransferase